MVIEKVAGMWIVGDVLICEAHIKADCAAIEYNLDAISEKMTELESICEKLSEAMKGQIETCPFCDGVLFSTADLNGRYTICDRCGKRMREEERCLLCDAKAVYLADYTGGYYLCLKCGERRYA